MTMSHVLPAGWEVIPLGDVVSVASGIGFPLNEQGQPTGDLPFFKVSDVSFAVRCSGGYLSHSNHFVSHAVADRLRGTPVDVGATVFAKIGEAVRLNRRAIVTVPCLIDNNVMAVKARRPLVDRYVYQFLRTVDFSQTVRSTTVPSLRKGDIESLRFPLAPIDEQQRIADKLDTVLARVDACRDRLARVAPLVKRFRQSVLAAATSGRLTVDWRGERATASVAPEASTIGLPTGWRRATFAEVCTEITVGFVGSMASQYVASGVPFLRSMNVRAFRFDPKGLQFISPEFHANLRKSALRRGDLAIVRSGAPGVCCVVPDDLGEANCSDLVIARPGAQLVAAYGCIFMNSSYGALHVAANQVGVAQAHFNVGAMKTTPLPLPGVPEQTEIVRRVETLFAYADRLEARLAQAQTAVDRLTPSLLAKAFRGELVPQDPADEPAAELLKRLAASRSAPAAKTRKPRQGQHA